MPEPVPSLRVVGVPGKGRGIVAGRCFAAGEVVDEAPVVVVPARQRAAVQETALSDYCFEWDETTGSVAVALGRASLFNHSYTPNVASEKHMHRRLLVFTALRDIAAGEEMTLNYNGDPANRDDVGFEVRG